MQPRAPRPLVDDAEPHGYKNPDAEMRPEMQIGLPADAEVAATPDFDELAADILDRIRKILRRRPALAACACEHAACEMWDPDLGAEKKGCAQPSAPRSIDQALPTLRLGESLERAEREISARAACPRIRDPRRRR